MSAVACRVALVPGRNVIGIELPNQDREMVFLRELLGAGEYENSAGDLTLAPGQIDRRRTGLRRSRADAASSDRRHDGFG